MNPNLIKTWKAAAATAAYLIVKFTAAETVGAASAATDLLIGTTTEVAAGAAGDPVDVVVGGVGFVTAGGSITIGSKITADSAGKAIAAAPAQGANAQILGVALAGASSGDVIPYLHALSVMQGA